MSLSNNAAMLLGLAGFLMGGIGVYFAVDARRTADDVWDTVQADGEMIEALGEQTRGAQEAMQAVNQRINGIQREERQLRDKVRELIEKIDETNARLEALRQAPRSTAGPQETESGPLTASAAEAEAREEEFRALREKVFAGEASADESARFWELARTTGVLDAVLADLEAKVEATPRDVDARMSLASAYVTKLLSVPNGPERGAWASKSEAQYSAVLEIEPDNWDARYSLGISFSQWPEFLNKTPDAIGQFEKLREIQERTAPEPRHAGVYLQLSQLYRRQGNDERSIEILRAGLDRHPDSEGLTKALDATTR